MKLGVIIPTYNSEKYIKECLDSIEKQTLKPDIVIVVDNNSTDNTALIVSESKLNGKWLDVLDKVNIGHSRNIGLVESIDQGCDLILMIDSDDTIEPNYIQDMVNVRTSAIEVPQWVVSSYQRSDGIFVDLMNGATVEQEKEQNRLSAFILANPRLLLRVGGYSVLAIAEDWELHTRLMMLGYKYTVNHKGGYNYRVHPESESSKHSNIEGNTKAILNVMKTEWQ